MSDEKSPAIFSGNTIFFYAYDIADAIDLDLIKQNRLVPTYTTPYSALFTNYHVPLSYHLSQNGLTLENDRSASQQGKLLPTSDACYILSKIHSFGVVSLAFRVPFKATLSDVKKEIIALKKQCDEQAERYAHDTYKKISPALTSPQFYNLKNEYFAVHVNPLSTTFSSEEIMEEYGADIASLVRLEVTDLSPYQQTSILRSRVGYYGNELMVIDSSGSFVYDEKCYDSIEMFEFATVQLLELQYFDRVLDQRLHSFYSKRTGAATSERQALLLAELAELRVDISFIVERLENSIRMAGDEYYTDIYDRLVKKLGIARWRESVLRKLSIVHDFYEVHQNNHDLLFHKRWTLVIVILIAIESIVGFVHLWAHYEGWLQ